MYVYLETKAEISKAQKALEATIRKEFNAPQGKVLGWQRGRVASQVVHHADGWWSVIGAGSYDGVHRYLNWFGRHSDGQAEKVAVEINVPLQGRNNATHGYFARHAKTGRVYLFHSGRVGGGPRGIGREAFLAWSGLELHQAVDSKGGAREGVIVMPVDGRWATQSAISYVQRIGDFKDDVRAGGLQSPEMKKRIAQLKGYFQESSGRRVGYSPGRVIDYESRHGDVVDALAKWVEKDRGLPKGGSLTKNYLIDLGVRVNGRLTEVWEVKSSTTRGDLYTAIGQLSVHAPDTACKQTVVLPADSKLPAGLQEAFERLGVNVMLYRLKKKGVALLL